MDLDQVLKDLPKLSFQDIEMYSQECSKQIIYDYLDKGKTFSQNAEYFDKCERVLAEFRQRLSQRVKTDSGIDLEHRFQAENGS